MIDAYTNNSDWHTLTECIAVAISAAEAAARAEERERWRTVSEIASQLGDADHWDRIANNDDHMVTIDHKDEMDLAELAAAAIRARGSEEK